MNMRVPGMAMALSGFLILQTGAALAGAEGTWRMSNGKVTVRVSDCGGNLCGTIVGLAKPLDKEGKPKRDKKNPNPSLRNRPVIGITILAGLKPDGDNEWKGRIYNPDDGNTYKSVVRMESESRLKVKGCVAVFCKTMDFVRIK